MFFADNDADKVEDYMFSTNLFGSALYVFSFLSNVFVTSLIGYKAW